MVDVSNTRQSEKQGAQRTSDWNPHFLIPPLRRQRRAGHSDNQPAWQIPGLRERPF